MVKIYFIVDINGLVYVGSTILELNQRFSKHKSDKKRNINNCSSRILDFDNSIIECIEECTEDNRKEREKYWINNIDCVNKNKLNFDMKEYDIKRNKTEKRKQYNKQYDKEYYQKNKEKRNQQQKEYRAKKKLANSN